MTKDNACGAAMEIARSLVQDEFHIVSALGNDADIDGAMLLVDTLIEEARTDATRLLSESQAHNAKLEAQVERMREALTLVYDSTAVLNHLPPESLDIICDALKP